MKERLVVLGTGSWGTALAIVAHRSGFPVALWGRRPDQVEALRRDRENRTHLPGIPIPPEVDLTADLDAAGSSELLVSAIPTQHIRATLAALAGHARKGARVLSLSKGIEIGTMARPSEILARLFDGPRVTALSGPTFADEVARGLPTTVVAASRDEAEAKFWQDALSGPSLRLYTSDDVAGVELAGALKNVIAIAAGICDALQLGDSARAALLSRGIVEMARLGTAMGARKSTFFGISGIGDLAASCTSRLGRNLRVGREVGAGRPLADVLASMDGVPEGVWTCTAARDLARGKGIELPITEEVCRVLHDGKPPREAVKSLMSRLPKSEAADLE